MFYKKNLNKTLQQAVDDAMAADKSEQVSLLSELALTRVVTGEAVQLYGAAIESGKQELKDSAGALMLEALKHVQSMAESAARIEANDKSKLDALTLTVVVNQITRIAWEVMGDGHESREFERRVREEVKLPDQTVGTDITPDMDVLAMDGTVPNE